MLSTVFFLCIDFRIKALPLPLPTPGRMGFHHLLINNGPYSPVMYGLILREEICLLNNKTLI